jgi:hypothetical protein
VSPETLRAVALEALSPHVDPRARHVLARAELVIVDAGKRWDGPRGPIVARTVGLGLSAFDLGRIFDAHGVRDALVAALATTIARDEGTALAELVLYFRPGAPVEGEDYRGTIAASDLGGAVVEFLRARGDSTAEAFAARARFALDHGAVRIDPNPPPALERALRESVAALTARVSP